MIEGEEEIGSPSLGKWCADNKDMLTADTILVSDTGLIAQDIPSITTGLRGLSYVEVKVTGPNRDLHSGLFGGAVANPANVLAKMIAGLTNDDNYITIPGFYDDVLEVSDQERAEMAKAPFNIDAYKKAIDVKAVFGEKGFSSNERTGIRPALDVNGIWSGYIGEGAKTVLPSKAFAKISSRLVPNQNHEKIAVMFEEYFTSIAPKSVKVKVESLHGGQAYVCPIDLPAYKAAEKAYEKIYELDESKKRQKYKTLETDIGSSSTGTKQIKEFFKNSVFSNPKPTTAITHLMGVSNLQNDDIIIPQVFDTRK